MHQITKLKLSCMHQTGISIFTNRLINSMQLRFCIIITVQPRIIINGNGVCALVSETTHANAWVVQLVAGAYWRAIAERLRDKARTELVFDNCNSLGSCRRRMCDTART
jgi:hypothetical protein